MTAKKKVSVKKKVSTKKKTTATLLAALRKDPKGKETKLDFPTQGCTGSFKTKGKGDSAAASPLKAIKIALAEAYKEAEASAAILCLLNSLSGSKCINSKFLGYDEFNITRSGKLLKIELKAKWKCVE